MITHKFLSNVKQSDLARFEAALAVMETQSSETLVQYMTDLEFQAPELFDPDLHKEMAIELAITLGMSAIRADLGTRTCEHGMTLASCSLCRGEEYKS